MKSQTVLVLSLVFSAVTARADVQWDGASHIDRFDRVPLCPVDGESFEVSFQVFDFDLTSARVAVVNGGTSFINAVYSHDRGIYDVWKATIPATSPTTVLEYYFELTDGGDTDYLGPAGMSDNPPAQGWTINFNTLSHAPLGSTPISGGGGVFKVWGAGSSSAEVAGEFTNWAANAVTMSKSGDFYTSRVNGANVGQMFKYIFDGSTYKPDARSRRLNPADNYNTFLVDPLQYAWNDAGFSPPPFEEAIIYQLHVGTFSGRNDGSDNDPGTYRDAVDLHLPHLVELGINVVQISPITEFPTDFSAGYNPVSYFATEFGYGDVDDLKYMVDQFHQAGIAVTLDIVWNHFSGSDNFLWNYTSDGGGASSQIYFDGDGTSGQFETPWGSQADFDRAEVRDYVADSALFWLDEMHFDGFRVDATDFMHSPNGQASGYSLLQRINDEIDRRALDKMIYAEQLPDNSYFTRPVANGGAGFDSQLHDRHKYGMRNAIFGAAFNNANMAELRETMLGRMNDSGNRRITDNIDGVTQTTTQLVKYFELHDEAWPESGGSRLVTQIDTTAPHDDEFARGRTLVGHAVNFFSPGIPSFLMGSEFLESTPFGANTVEESRLDWTKPNIYSDYLQAFKDMIRIRKENPAFRSNAGAEINHLNDGGDVLTLHRWDGSGNDLLVVISLNNSNLSGYRVGFPQAGTWYQLFNSQAAQYGGNNAGVLTSINTEPIFIDGYGQSAVLTVPRMSAMVFRLAECTQDTACDDFNDCTANLCDLGQCEFTEPPADGVAFADCLAGPDVPPAPTMPGGCLTRCYAEFDFDEDGDVDLADYNDFQDNVFVPDEVIEYIGDATGWLASAPNAESYAFDSFFPGVTGVAGLTGDTAILNLTSRTLTVNLGGPAAGQPAIRDQINGSQASDAYVPINFQSTWTFDQPIFGLYTFYGSLANAATMHMKLYRNGQLVADFSRGNAGSATAASGHGFRSTFGIDEVEFSFVGADLSVLVGAYSGVTGIESNLGTIEIPGYNGPNGSTVQLDFAIVP